MSFNGARPVGQGQQTAHTGSQSAVKPTKKPAAGPTAAAQVSRDAMASGSGQPGTVSARAVSLVSTAITPKPGTANPDLMKAIKEKDVTAVEMLLVKQRVPAGGADPYGTTPLSLAAQQGNDDIVQALLKAGANIHETTYGSEPFLTAVGTCSLATVKLFMAKGAKTTVQDESGATVLHHAAQNKDPGVAKAMLAAGIKVDVQTEQRMTPLMIAAGHDNRAVVDVLMKAGADPNKLGYKGEWGERETGVIATTRFQDPRLLQWFLDHGTDPNYAPKDGGTLLAMAVMNKNPAAIDLLLARGASPDKGSPLSAATDDDDTSTLKTLLAAGANVNGDGSNEWTPLLSACLHGKPEPIEILLQHGASLDAATKDGDFPLLMASWAKTSKPIELLIKAGANVNQRNDKGETALQRSTNELTGASVKALLAAGANPNVSSDDGESPLDRAMFHGNQIAFDALLAAGADPSMINSQGESVLMRAAIVNAGEFIPTLVAKGANVQFTDAEGRNALHVGTMSRDGASRSIKQLLDAGLDANSTDKQGNTPLMYASQRVWSHATKALLAGGAAIHQTNRAGATALDMSVATAEPWEPDPAAELIKAGADVNHRGPGGITALERCIDRKYLKTIKAAVEAGARLDVPDADGRTPLMRACNAKRPDGSYDRTPNEITDLIAGTGRADVNHQDKDGNTALMLAAMQGNVMMISTLVHTGADKDLTNKDGKTAMDLAVDAMTKEVIRTGAVG
jgi:ankyrin repeat protein